MSNAEKNSIEEICLKNCQDFGLQPSEIQTLQKDKIIVAVSGGSDSIALLILLNKYFDVIAVAINHNKRPESKSEIEFIDKLCQKLNIKFISQDINPLIFKKNFQSSARNVRYQILINCALQHNIKFIAVGHHLDDLTESFILKILRGAGAFNTNKILILEKIKVIRPLFNITKDKLQNFLMNQKIAWIEDSSNQSLVYERNKIRFGLSELFKFIDKNTFQNNLLKSISNLEKINYLAHRYIDLLKEKHVKYSEFGYVLILEFNFVDKITLFYILQEIIYQLNSQKEVRSKKIESIIDQLHENEQNDEQDMHNNQNRQDVQYEDMRTKQYEDMRTNNVSKKFNISNLCILKYKNTLIIYKMHDKSKLIPQKFQLNTTYFDIFCLKVKNFNSGISCKSFIGHKDTSIFDIDDKNIILENNLTIDFLNKNDYVELNKDLFFRKKVQIYKQKIKNDLAQWLDNDLASSIEKLIIQDFLFNFPVIKTTKNFEQQFELCESNNNLQHLKHINQVQNIDLNLQPVAIPFLEYTKMNLFNFIHFEIVLVKQKAFFVDQ